MLHVSYYINFDFKLRRDHQEKNTSDRHAYESVDGKSLF